MMANKSRTYNREFKLEAVKLGETSDKGMAEIRIGGINEGCIRQWKRELADSGRPARAGRPAAVGPLVSHHHR